MWAPARGMKRCSRARRPRPPRGWLAGDALPPAGTVRPLHPLEAPRSIGRGQCQGRRSCPMGWSRRCSLDSSLPCFGYLMLPRLRVGTRLSPGWVTDHPGTASERTSVRRQLSTTSRRCLGPSFRRLWISVKRRVLISAAGSWAPTAAPLSVSQVLIVEGPKSLMPIASGTPDGPERLLRENSAVPCHVHREGVVVEVVGDGTAEVSLAGRSRMVTDRPGQDDRYADLSVTPALRRVAIDARGTGSPLPAESDRPAAHLQGPYPRDPRGSASTDPV